VRELTDKERLERFLVAVGRVVRRPLRLYLVGGAEMVDLGLRPTTLDIDIAAEDDGAGGVADLERALPGIKDRLSVNVEWADPTGFLPIPRGPALERSPWRRAVGSVQVHHFDLVAVALAKVARSSAKDLDDVELLIRHGLVRWSDVERLWRDVRDRPFGRAKQSPRDVAARMRAVRDDLRARGLTRARRLAGEDPAAVGGRRRGARLRFASPDGGPSGDGSSARTARG
jgi:hypothetical protein